MLSNDRLYSLCYKDLDCFYFAQLLCHCAIMYGLNMFYGCAMYVLLLLKMFHLLALCSYEIQRNLVKKTVF